MNVLLTGAGRRTFLVEFFKQAVRPRGSVIACDSSAEAPALGCADARVIVPPMDHPDYFETLLRICAKYSIGLIVSVNDIELAGLARHAERFRSIGTIPLIASPEVIATCQDKWAAHQWLRARGLPVPKTYLTLGDVREALDSGELRFPLIVKPRWGTSSIGVEVVENERELKLALEWGEIQLRRTILSKLNQADSARSFIIQDRIQGEEYGIDVVNDLDGNHVTTFARRKLAIRAGNTDRALSVTDPRLWCIGKVLGEALRHIGSVDCDLMMADEACFVLDVNPRLGGGYPFSHMAGANLPAALVAWAEYRQPDPEWLRCEAGVLCSKYDDLMLVHAHAAHPDLHCGA